MELKLIREEFSENSTIGKLYVNDEFECYVLEDPVRETKIYGKTAIPAGTYNITITYSPKYKRYLPLLNNVPNYSGIRIHPGNKPEDTEGCLLPGEAKSKDWVSKSKKAFDKLYPKLVYASQQGEKVTITIS